MRALQYKFSGVINGESHWTPVFIQIGSHLHGKRFQKGSILFEHHEVENALTDSERFRRWVSLLNLHYQHETPSNF